MGIESLRIAFFAQEVQTLRQIIVFRVKTRGMREMLNVLGEIATTTRQFTEVIPFMRLKEREEIDVVESTARM